MNITKKLLNLFLPILVALFIFIPTNLFASETDGIILPDYKYAWSDNMGWINWGTALGNVHVTDSLVTGYGWILEAGWIDLEITPTGITNNGEGVLSGYAWGANTGWIIFDGVRIDANGEFTGFAIGETIGKISFSCTNVYKGCLASPFRVKTDWRPISGRTGNIVEIINKAEKTYSYKLDGEREDFRDTNVEGVSKQEFEAAYEQTIEDLLKINAGFLGTVKKFKDQQGRNDYVKYVSGRLSAEDMLEKAKGKTSGVVYRNTGRPTAAKGQQVDEKMKVSPPKEVQERLKKLKEAIYRKSLIDDRSREQGGGIRKTRSNEEEAAATLRRRKLKEKEMEEYRERRRKLFEEGIEEKNEEEAKDELKVSKSPFYNLFQNLKASIFKILNEKKD